MTTPTPACGLQTATADGRPVRTTCAVGIECERGYDICPICDPCTCPSGSSPAPSDMTIGAAPPITPALTAVEVAAVTAVLVDVAREWSDASVETGGDWPEGACVETSVMLRDELLRACPTVEPAYVWGAIVIAGVPIGHAWVGLRDDTIADATIGQFLVAPPSHREANAAL